MRSSAPPFGIEPFAPFQKISCPISGRPARDIGHANDLLRRHVVSRPGTFLLDLAHELDGERQHPDEYRGVPLFADGSHFSPEAGARLSPWIVDQVTRALAPRSGS
jgi:hypothetical protein